MPKKVHDKLLREGRAKGLTGKRLDSYVYGTLNKIEKAKSNPKKKAKKKITKRKTK